MICSIVCIGRLGLRAGQDGESAARLVLRAHGGSGGRAASARRYRTPYLTEIS